MFERPCYQKLDEPVLVWLGLEFWEICVALGVGVLGAFGAALLLGLGGFLLGFGAGGGLLVLFRALKKGGPGHVFARLYRRGLVELLPRGLRPRHLLPLPARQAKIRLSAVLGQESKPRNEDALRYFGR